MALDFEIPECVQALIVRKYSSSDCDIFVLQVLSVECIEPPLSNPRPHFLVGVPALRKSANCAGLVPRLDFSTGMRALS